MQEEGQGSLGIEPGKDSKKGFYKSISSKRKVGENVRLMKQMGHGRSREGGNTECLLFLRLYR